MQASQSKLFHFIAFINLIALLVVPQLNNVHYDPLPQFWAEMSVAWASISLFLITCFSLKELNIPTIVIPLAIFAIYLYIQQFFVHIDFIGLSYVSSLEMFVCILLAIGISTLRKQLGLENIVTMICVSLIIGALLQSTIGLLQYTGLYKYFGNYIFYDSSHPTTNIFGHFGQRNHYCHYLTWAIFGVIYLLHKQKIKLPLFLLLAGWLIFSMTIASSRSVFIYFATGTLISFLYALFKRNKDSRKLFLTILLISTALIIFEFVFPEVLKLFTHVHQIDSGLQRLATDASDGGLTGRRMTEWEKAWMVFKQHPILGYGWNEYAKQSVYLQPLFPHAPLNSGLFTNCHNLILQLLAESGLVGTITLIGGLIYIMQRILKQDNIESIIILCMILTTLDHSMVEYPLWYLYFLGPLVMFLALDKPLFKINSNIASGITVLPLSYLVYVMFNGSFIYDTLVNYIDAPSEQKAFTRQAKYVQNILDTNPLWAYSASYTLDSYINIDEPLTNMTYDIPTQLKYENILANFHPYPDNMISQAKLYWKLGDKQKARYFVNLALVSFPVYKSSYLSALKGKRYKELYDIANTYKYTSK